MDNQNNVPTLRQLEEQLHQASLRLNEANIAHFELHHLLRRYVMAQPFAPRGVPIRSQAFTGPIRAPSPDSLPRGVEAQALGPKTYSKSDLEVTGSYAPAQPVLPTVTGDGSGTPLPDFDNLPKVAANAEPPAVGKVRLRPIELWLANRDQRAHPNLQDPQDAAQVRRLVLHLKENGEKTLASFTRRFQVPLDLTDQLHYVLKCLADMKIIKAESRVADGCRRAFTYFSVP